MPRAQSKCSVLPSGLSLRVEDSPESSVLRKAFTLIEVMLALFIALLLLLGTNEVFRASSQTISAGNALNDAVRNGRAVQPIFFNDLQNCASDSPVFIISSSMVPQYLNAADATASFATPGAVPPTTGCLLSDHLHRCDQLMFFARGLYRRKSTDSPYLASTTARNEAYIHYGHLRTLANDGVTYIGPDDYAGASEPYAASWVLGRNAVLLNDSNVPAYSLPGNVNESGYNTGSLSGTSASKIWLQNPSNSPNPIYPADVAPFAYNTPYGPTNAATYLQNSRYDLAYTTIDEFRSVITNAAFAQAQQNPASATPYCFWWAPFVYQQPHYKLDTTVGTPYQQTPLISTLTGPAPVSPFGTGFSTVSGANQWFPRNRFQGSSIPSPTPLTSQDQAGLAPFFQEHISQFIVEYAGDFTTQDTLGNVTDTVPDGQIDWMYATKGDWVNGSSYSAGDFVIYNNGIYYQAQTNVAAGGAAPTGTAPWIAATPPQQIRWYGMPRDATGSGSIPSSYPTPKSISNELNNVVPLADLWHQSRANFTRPLPYEVESIPSLIAPTAATVGASAAALNSFSGDYAALTNPASARYTAVWRNDVPAMVRILMKIDDPTNALQNGPWFEYVFKLK